MSSIPTWSVLLLYFLVKITIKALSPDPVATVFCKSVIHSRDHEFVKDKDQVVFFFGDALKLLVSL